MPFPLGQAIIAAILGAFFGPWLLALVTSKKQTAGY